MADASLGTAVLRTKLDTTGLKTGLNQAKTETEKFGKDGVTAIKGIGAAFGAVAASQGVRAYVSFMRSAAQEANLAATAADLFEKAVRRNNESVTEGASMVQRLSDRFGVAANVIEDAATTMLRQGATLEQVEKTILTAGASAAAAGFDIATAFENVTTAVVSGNSVLLRSSGIIAGLGEAERAYAREVGKTVEQLTEQERIQARVNAIYHETRYEIEDLDRILQGLPRAQAEVARQMSVFRQTAGDLALKVITPLTEGFGTMLRIVNDLPAPVKNAGIAMAGAATGATALATGIVAIKAALTGLSGLGLLSFGPAGWVVLGVTAVAGLAAALSGRRDSLDSAAKKASEAFNKGDANSLTGALDEVVGKFDGEFKAALRRAQEELRRTGTVGAESANVIVRAMESALAQAQVANVGIGFFNRYEPISAALNQAGASMFGDRAIPNARERVETALRLGNFEEALDVVRRVVDLLSSNAPRSGAIDALSEFQLELERASQRIRLAEFKPPAPSAPGGATPLPGPTGAPSDPITVEVAERAGRPRSPATLGAMDRAEAGGPSAGMSTGLSEAEVTAALRANRDARAAEAEAARLAAAEIAVRTGQQRREMEAIAGVNAAREQARETLANLGAGVQAFAGNVREARDAVVDARWGDTNAELERFQRNAASLTATLKAAADQEAFAAGLQVFSDRQRGVFGRGSAFAVGPVQSDAEAASNRQAIRDAVRDFEDGRITIEQLEAAINDITSVTPMTVRELNELGASIVALKEAARARDFEENPGLYGLPRPVDLGITPTANITGGAVDLTGFQPTVLIDGLDPEEWAARQKRAADSFADTVVSAGFSFGNAAIKAFQDGDVVGVIRAGLSGAGSILGGANLGSLSFLGGSIGIGGLLAGGLGLLGTLLGGLFGGDRNRELEQRRQAEASRARSVPAININFTVNQTNTYNGAPSQPENEQAFRRQADALFESLYRRHLDPRLKSIEARLGIAGA